MPIEFTSEYAERLYKHADNMQKTGDYVYAIRLLEKLVEVADAFFTPFALVRVAQAYKQIGRRDLETEAFIRITRLPHDQQRLVKPTFLAYSYQRVGNFRAAREIHSEILELAPRDMASIAALAELTLLEDK